MPSLPNKFLTLIAATAILPTTNAWAQENPLKATITLGQTSILPYEPLSVVISLQNTSTKDAVPLSSLESSLEIMSAGKDWGRYPEPFICIVGGSKYKLAPGGKLSVYRLVHALNGESQFNQPGSYQLRGSIGFVTSGPINLKVNNSPLEAKAFEYLKTTNLHKFFGTADSSQLYDFWPKAPVPVSPSEQLQKFETDAEEFIRQFPTSRYTAWVKLAQCNHAAAFAEWEASMAGVAKIVNLQSSSSIRETLERRFGKQYFTALLDNTNPQATKETALRGVLKRTLSVSDELPTPVKARALILASTLAKDLQEKELEAAYLQQAAKINPEATNRIEVALRNGTPNPALIRVIAPALPRKQTRQEQSELSVVAAPKPMAVFQPSIKTNSPRAPRSTFPTIKSQLTP